MSRRSTVAVSTLVPALKVLSTTLPVSTFFSVVRTKAPPFPGLTCWNAVTDHSWPSRLSTRPFFRSFVVATGYQPTGRRHGGGQGVSCRGTPPQAGRQSAGGAHPRRFAVLRAAVPPQAT